MTRPRTTTCPRCAGRHAGEHLCQKCQGDQRLERRSGVSIPKELWPIEGLAEFQAQAALADLRMHKA